VIDLTREDPAVVRTGRGDIRQLGLVAEA